MTLPSHEPSCLQAKLNLTPPPWGSTFSVVGPSGPGTCFQAPKMFSPDSDLTSVADWRATRTTGRARDKKPPKNNARRIFASSPWEWTGLWANTTLGRVHPSSGLLDCPEFPRGEPGGDAKAGGDRANLRKARHGRAFRLIGYSGDGYLMELEAAVAAW